MPWQNVVALVISLGILEIILVVFGMSTKLQWEWSA